MKMELRQTPVGVFQKVLVPVEFETVEAGEAPGDRAVRMGDRDWVAVAEWTAQALELASRLAAGGKVVLVHATHDFNDYATWAPPKGLAELNDGAGKYATTVLEALAENHCHGVEVECVIRPGNALDVILGTALQATPDAIVLAASARRRVSRAFLGSTADKVIRRSQCPVVVVPSGTA